MTKTFFALHDDVAQHWNRCLEVNSSWREFTHQLGVLNALDMLCIEDVEFVAELLLNNELFENETFEDLVDACYDFAQEREVDADLIDATDLWNVVEGGATVMEVAEAATEYGVSVNVINDFAEA